MPTRLLPFLKKKSVLATLVVLLGGGGLAYAHFAKPTQPLRYVLVTAQKQTIVTSVTASGQVSGENQIDLKPSVSGKILSIGVKAGAAVTTSTVLFTVDPKEAQKTVRDAAQSLQDARLSLGSAQLSLQKLQQPADSVSLTQTQHAVDQARRTLTNLQAGPDPMDVQQTQQNLNIEEQKLALSSDGKTPNMIRDAYDAVIPTIRNASQTTQTALRDMDDMIRVLGQTNLNGSYEYNRLLSAMDPTPGTNNNLYQSVQQAGAALKTRADVLRLANEDPANIDTLLPVARTALDLLTPLLQQAEALTQSLNPSTNLTQSTIDSLQSSIHSDRADVSSKSTSITSALQSTTQIRSSAQAQQLNIDKARLALDKVLRGNDPDDIRTAEERLTEAEATLAKLRQGASVLDIATSQNSVEQRRSALAAAQARLVDAQQALQDYTVRAPFAGIMATVTARVGDQASASTAFGTLLTKTKMATVSLNEVDVSKIAVGQKANLTFDAVPDLQIAGTVSQIDTIGTASQGVVNYSVKVGFLTEDDRVKPGMSVNVSIITAVHADVLAVANAAVQYFGSQASVSILSEPIASSTSEASGAQGVTSPLPPETRLVQTGLANDTYTEITEGLSEGTQVVVRTIDPNTTAAATTNRQTTATTGLRIPGLTGGGAGGGATFRAVGGR